MLGRVIHHCILQCRGDHLLLLYFDLLEKGANIQNHLELLLAVLYKAPEVKDWASGPERDGSSTR
jgi:hypothetical protein